MKLKYKIIFAITIVMAVISWIIAAYYWNQLPSTIPVHFGISGQADAWANKSILQVLILPILQTIITGVMIFTYYKPQYSNIPSTIWLTMLDDKNKERAYSLIRTMLVGVALLISILLTYMVYMMNLSAINTSSNMSPWFMLSVIVVMLAWLVFWAIKINRATKVLAGKKK